MKCNLNVLMSVCAFLALTCTLAAVERPAESVIVGKVTTLEREISRKYIGTVSAVDDVSLIARVPGVIEKQLFGNGDMVTAGQELFIIEDTTYIAARNSAKAKLDQCRAEYEFAKRNLQRLTALWATKAASESSYDEAVRLEATCKAAIAAAEAALLDAENNLSYTRIVSPISGKTGKAAVSPGNYVSSANGPLIDVVSLDKMYINFFMSMNDYLSTFGSFDKLRDKAVVQIIMADGSIYPEKAEIVFMDNRVDKDTDSIRIRALVENNDMKLLPDSIISVRIISKDDARTSVPISAVMSNANMNYVYVLDDKNCAQIRPVELGETQGRQQIITKGLAEGETIIFDGAHKAIPGRPVNPVAR